MSKKNVSRVVSGLGLGLGILEGLTAAIRNVGGTDEDIDRLGSEEGRDLLAKMAKLAIVRKDDSYASRFVAAVEACGFTWWNKDRLTPENFPNESFGGDYDLEWRRLPSNPNGYKAPRIDAVVRVWQKEDATIIGSASAGDGLFLAKEFKAGRRDQPNGWIVCPGSASVDGGLLGLVRGGTDRWAGVGSRDGRWGVGGFVLLRKVRQP